MNAAPAKPIVVIIAGPNGAGKSTVAPHLLRHTIAVLEFVNADTIASGLSAFRPESVAIAAGRIMLARMRALAAARADFAFETTLASRIFAPWLADLQASGYDVHLLFLWLRSPELAVSRVAQRVRLGGHDIPVSRGSPPLPGWIGEFFAAVSASGEQLGAVRQFGTGRRRNLADAERDLRWPMNCLPNAL